MPKWDAFVDLVTVVWIGLFFTSLVEPTTVPDTLMLALLAIFIIDVGVKYRRVGNLRRFIVRHWIDILMVIPYFRIFRALRLLRMFRILRTAKIAKAGRFPGLQRLEALRRKGTRIARRLGGPKSD